jgi:spore coat protein CotH
VVEGEAPLTDVAVKLKGAAGSFQELDGKPAFTLNVGKFLKGQEFHRLRKFHLNNSAQDESYTSEWLCASICRDLGLPATRVAHARVWLNDRDLGLYVLKEGFDRNFLRRNFTHPGGNLYDGGFCQEIDAELERDAAQTIGPTCGRWSRHARNPTQPCGRSAWPPSSTFPCFTSSGRSSC